MFSDVPTSDRDGVTGVKPHVYRTFRPACSYKIKANFQNKSTDQLNVFIPSGKMLSGAKEAEKDVA